MLRAVAECTRAARDFDAGAVHDLRVALRRCRSMADGFMTFDPHPGWREMKKEGKRLFNRLGDLRDTHVMIDWVQRLGAAGDAAAAMLTGYLTTQEQRLRELALDALQEFDARKWLSWSSQLSVRAARIPAASLAFKHLALERWQEAHELHRLALRNRSQVAFHRLRIGLKRFRYTVENFLPNRQNEWDADLRDLQDLLGETHDLYVLWRTALKIGALKDSEVRQRWRDRIVQERGQRLTLYRQKMCGRGSLWWAWRAGLPAGGDVTLSAMAGIEQWAAYRDPDITHARHVAMLALQLFAGLAGDMLPGGMSAEVARSILQAAALMHDVGRAQATRKHHRISGRMIRKLDPPLGMDPKYFPLAALVARYHRGALPRLAHKRLAGLPDEQRRLVMFLAGILRLANAFDLAHDRRIRHLETQRSSEVLLIRAHGYSARDPLAPKLACARHLLEVVCGMPVWFDEGAASG